MSSYFDFRAGIGAAKNLLLMVLSIGLFVGFGPPTIPIPTRPDVHIKDVHASLVVGPSKPLEGPFAPNDALLRATVLFNDTLMSRAESESVMVNEDGSVLLMDKYGHVSQAVPDLSAPGGYRLETFPNVQLGPGRPLGFKKYIDGSIIVCNAGLGLVKLDLPAPGRPAQVTLLGSYVTPDSPIDADTQIIFPNDLAITKDGSVVYFTDSQVIPVLPNWGSVPRGAQPWYDTFHSFLLGQFSGQATGRLLAYYPNNGSIHVLAKGFWFSNGLALSEEEDYLIMAETSTLRLLRYWIRGKSAGRAEVFLEGLPGFPDGVNLAAGGKGFWVSLPAPRTALYDAAVKFRGLRVILSWLPARFLPNIQSWGVVFLVNTEGEVVQWLVDPSGGHVGSISDVEEQVLSSGKSRLWLGFVKNNRLAYIDI